MLILFDNVIFMKVKLKINLPLCVINDVNPDKVWKFGKPEYGNPQNEFRTPKVESPKVQKHRTEY